MSKRESNARAQTIDLACPSCGARVGERCSDTDVFIRDAAFTSSSTPTRKPPPSIVEVP
jgi:hypothetical protein